MVPPCTPSAALGCPTPHPLLVASVADMFANGSKQHLLAKLDLTGN